jgi:hypothetical protein
MKPDDVFFEAVQKIGATGILKGKGVPYKWANQTWIYPNQPMSQYDLVDGLKPYYPSLKNYLEASGELLTLASLLTIFEVAGVKLTESKVRGDWQAIKAGEPLTGDQVLNRKTIAWLVDKYLQPFERPVDIKGYVQVSAI